MTRFRIFKNPAFTLKGGEAIIEAYERLRQDRPSGIHTLAQALDEEQFEDFSSSSSSSSTSSLEDEETKATSPIISPRCIVTVSEAILEIVDHRMSPTIEPLQWSLHRLENSKQILVYLDPPLMVKRRITFHLRALKEADELDFLLYMRPGPILVYRKIGCDELLEESGHFDLLPIDDWHLNAGEIFDKKVRMEVFIVDGEVTALGIAIHDEADRPLAVVSTIEVD